jgi:hypothetical protein
MTLEDYLQALVEGDAMLPSQNAEGVEATTREEAVRRMIAFGENYHLNFGQPITRDILHEGHRF